MSAQDAFTNLLGPGPLKLPDVGAVGSLPSVDASGRQRRVDPGTGLEPDVDDLGQIFSRKLNSGLNNQLSDFNAARAGFNKLVGDEDDAAKYMNIAADYEWFAGENLEGLQTFGEFLEAPTLDGLLKQTAGGFASALPSVATTIGSAVAGGLTFGAAPFAAAGASVASKAIIKKLVTDSTKKAAAGSASVAERALADTAYKYAKNGMLVGAIASEYPVMTGGNLKEAIETGQAFDNKNVLRAGAVAVPQTAIGVFFEKKIFDTLADQVKKVAVEKAGKAGTGSIMAEFAKNVGGTAVKGAAAEGTAEFLQEGIGAANRFNLDDDYTWKDAKLRLAEAAFVGALAGGGVAGSGATVGSTATAASRIMQKADKAIMKAAGQDIEGQIDSQEANPNQDSSPAPEKEADINAQINEVRKGNKQVAFVPNENPQGLEPGKVFKALSAAGDVIPGLNVTFIEGEGTFYSKSVTNLENLIKSKSRSQADLEAEKTRQLERTQSKENLDPQTLSVVEVVNSKGNIIHFEETDQAGLAAASRNASEIALRNDDSEVRVRSVTEHLGQRAAPTDAAPTAAPTPAAEPEFDSTLGESRGFNQEYDKALAFVTGFVQGLPVNDLVGKLTDHMASLRNELPGAQSFSEISGFIRRMELEGVLRQEGRAGSYKLLKGITKADTQAQPTPAAESIPTSVYDDDPTLDIPNPRVTGRSPLRFGQIPVKRGDYKKPRQDKEGNIIEGTFVGAYFNKKTQTIFIDPEYLKSQFDKKPWENPKVEGVSPLPKSFADAFLKTPDDWVRFVELHELAHTEFPQLEGESKADYENRMNQIAMLEMQNPMLFVSAPEEAILDEDTQRITDLLDEGTNKELRAEIDKLNAAGGSRIPVSGNKAQLRERIKNAYAQQGLDLDDNVTVRKMELEKTQEEQALENQGLTITSDTDPITGQRTGQVITSGGGRQATFDDGTVGFKRRALVSNPRTDDPQRLQDLRDKFQDLYFRRQIALGRTDKDPGIVYQEDSRATPDSPRSDIPIAINWEPVTTSPARLQQERIQRVEEGQTVPDINENLIPDLASVFPNMSPAMLEAAIEALESSRPPTDVRIETTPTTLNGKPEIAMTIAVDNADLVGQSGYAFPGAKDSNIAAGTVLDRTKWTEEVIKRANRDASTPEATNHDAQVRNEATKQVTNVNLAKLVDAGRGISPDGAFDAANVQGNPTADLRRGLENILAELQVQGYSVRAGGRQIISGKQRTGNQSEKLREAAQAGATLRFAQVLDPGNTDPGVGMIGDREVKLSEVFVEGKERGVTTREGSVDRQVGLARVQNEKGEVVFSEEYDLRRYIDGEAIPFNDERYNEAQLSPAAQATIARAREQGEVTLTEGTSKFPLRSAVNRPGLVRGEGRDIGDIRADEDQQDIDLTGRTAEEASGLTRSDSFDAQTMLDGQVLQPELVENYYDGQIKSTQQKIDDINANKIKYKNRASKAKELKRLKDLKDELKAEKFEAGREEILSQVGRGEEGRKSAGTASVDTRKGVINFSKSVGKRTKALITAGTRLLKLTGKVNVIALSDYRKATQRINKALEALEKAQQPGRIPTPELSDAIQISPEVTARGLPSVQARVEELNLAIAVARREFFIPDLQPRMRQKIQETVAEMGKTNPGSILTDIRGDQETGTAGNKTRHVILYDDTVGNPAEQALVIAHELGHALFNEEMAYIDSPLNRKYKEKLIEEFNIAKAKPGAPAQYQTEVGFEEWLADQYAIEVKNKIFEEAEAGNINPIDETKLTARTVNINGVPIEMGAKLITRQGEAQTVGVPTSIAARIKAVVDQIFDLFKNISKTFKARFGEAARSQTFSEFFVDTIKDRDTREPTNKFEPVNFSKRAMVTAIENAGQPGKETNIEYAKSFIDNLKDSMNKEGAFKVYKKIREIILPSITILSGFNGSTLILTEAGTAELNRLGRLVSERFNDLVEAVQRQNPNVNASNVNRLVQLYIDEKVTDQDIDALPEAENYRQAANDQYNFRNSTAVEQLDDAGVPMGERVRTSVAGRSVGQIIADMFEPTAQSGERNITGVKKQIKLNEAVNQAATNLINTVNNVPGTSVTTITQAQSKAATIEDPAVAEALSAYQTADTENQAFYFNPEGKGTLGFIRSKDLAKARLRDKLMTIVGGDLSSEQVKAALDKAASKTPTQEMAEGSVERQIREFLAIDVYENYLAKVGHGLNLGFIEDFFPRSLDLNEINARSQEFVEIIVAEKTAQGADPRLYLKDGVQRSGLFDDVKRTVDKLQKFQDKIDNDMQEQEEPSLSAMSDPFNRSPFSKAEHARELTAGIDSNVLGDFLEPPDVALNSYLNRVIKRAEWRRATFSEAGKDRLGPLLNQLNEEDRAKAEEIVQAYLGYVPKPLPSWLRTLNSYGQLFNFVTLLPFAALASLPDLAGPFINNKDWDGFVASLKEMPDVIGRNFKEAKAKNRERAKVARDMGIVSRESIASTLISQGEEDFMNLGARKLSNAFFTATGLTAFTNFSRAFAVGMGRQFIIRHAETKPNEEGYESSIAYLSELGLTQDMVNAWLSTAARDNDGNVIDYPELTPEVENAIQRFAESSILRPNAAQRPLWASDPRFQLIWQLKSFAYAYGKTILGGIKNAVHNKQERDKLAGRPDQGLTQIPVSAAVLVATTLPLTMLGLELREYTKSLLAFLIPGETHLNTEGEWKYLRSDKMDWGDYSWEMVKRSGVLGYAALFEGASQASQYGDNPAISLLGPSAQFLEQWGQATVSGNYESAIDRTIPLKSSI